jgi:zinc and cadmium transporter
MQLILYGLIGSMFALTGGLLVLWRREYVKKIMTSLLAFSAAAFIGVSFLDLLPEAIEAVEEPHYIFFAFLAGITLFFALERGIMKYFKRPVHSHGEHEDEHTESLPALVIAGDALHNFLDGVAIAIAFVVNPALGLTTALAIAAHEIPQEIADFSILLDRGWSNAKVIWANVLSGLTAFIGIGVGYFAASSIEAWLPYMLAGVAGIFTYIGLSDLIPEIHHRAGHKHFNRVLVPFVFGLLLVGYMVTLTHV